MTPPEAGGRAPQAAPTTVRLDVWLDVACLFRTRSEAQKACRGGKVDVNGQGAKPHRVLRVGDQLRITRAAGRKQQVVIKAVVEQQAGRELERHFWKSRLKAAPRTPDRRERRRLRSAKEGES
jgi:ribosome-associated heat shock protein Hsp15